MKSYVKYLVLLVAFIVTAKADTSVYPLSTTVGTISQITTGGKINQLVFANSQAAANTIKFYDSADTALTYTNGVYTNAVQAVTTVITTNTTVNGLTWYSTNQVQTTTFVPVSATVVNKKLLLQYVVPASTTVTYTPITPISFTRGLAVNNTVTNIAITIDYTASGQ